MKRNGFAQIPLMIGLLIMAVAIPVATKLVQTNQENRGKAYEAPECVYATDCGTEYNCISGKCVPKTTSTPIPTGTTLMDCPNYQTCGTTGSCVTYVGKKGVAQSYVCPTNDSRCPNNCPQPTKVPTLGIPTLTQMPIPTPHPDMPTPTPVLVDGALCDVVGKCGDAGGCKSGERCASVIDGSGPFCKPDSACSATLTPIKVPTKIPTITPTVCVDNDKCKAEGATCCSGYSVYSTTCVDKQVCKAVTACVANDKCKAEGATCCSGYYVYDATCSTQLKCKVEVIPTPGCLQDPGLCSKNEQCCGGRCDFSGGTGIIGKCMTVPLTIPTLAPTLPACYSPGKLCSKSNQCCSGYCNIPTGKTGGYCQTLPTATPTATNPGVTARPTIAPGCDPTKYKDSKSGTVWLHFDDAYTAACICSGSPTGTTYHYVCGSNFWACGDGSKSTSCPSCIESCPNSSQTNLLQSCSPVDTDGTSKDALCTAAGITGSCGGKTYCCPSAGGAWTTDMTKCSAVCQVKTGVYTLNDFSVWRSEFIEGNLGSVSRNTWNADFDCDGKVTLNDFSIWRTNFINSLIHN